MSTSTNFESICRAIRDHERENRKTFPSCYEREKLPTPLRIMSFDGGPSALITLGLLKKFEENDSTKGMLEKTAMFCGTSNGALIALSLSHYLQQGETALDAIRKTQEGQYALASNLNLRWKDVFNFSIGSSPLFPKQFSNFINKTYADKRLSDLTQRPVNVVAHNATNNRLASYMASGHGKTTNVTVVQAALGASSIPLLLPFSRATADEEHGYNRPQPGDWLLDGGLASNDPTLAGLSTVLRNLTVGGTDIYWTARKYLPYIRLLSLGSCPYAWDPSGHLKDRHVDQAQWGWRQLLRAGAVRNMVNIFAGGPSTFQQEPVKKLIGIHRFHRTEWDMSILDTALIFATAGRYLKKKHIDYFGNKSELRTLQRELRRRHDRLHHERRKPNPRALGKTQRRSRSFRRRDRAKALANPRASEVPQHRFRVQSSTIGVALSVQGVRPPIP